MVKALLTEGAPLNLTEFCRRKVCMSLCLIQEINSSLWGEDTSEFIDSSDAAVLSSVRIPSTTGGRRPGRGLSEQNRIGTYVLEAPVRVTHRVSVRVTQEMGRAHVGY